MKLIRGYLIAIALALCASAPSLADTTVNSAPVPWGQVGPTETLAATGTSGTVVLGWTQVTPRPQPPPQTIVVCNTATGAVDAYVLPVGTSASVVTTGTGTLVPAGACQYIAQGAPTNYYLAAITGGSSTTLAVMTGTGTLPAGGSAGVITGTVTANPGTMTGAVPATVTIPAATATNVIAAGTYKHACIINSGTGQMWWSYGTAVGTPATVNSFPLAPAAGAGQQGGAFCWDSGGPVPTNGVNVYSTAGTTVVAETGN